MQADFQQKRPAGRRISECALLSCLVLALIPLPARGQGVTIGLNNSGLSSLKYNGLELIGHGDFRVGGVIMRDASGSTFRADPNVSVQLDQAGQSLNMQYSWGSIQCKYSVSGNRLNLNIITTNTSSYTIQGVFYEPLAIQFPSPVLEYDGNTPLLLTGNGASTAESMSYSSGVLVLSNDAPQKPLMLGFPWAIDRPASSTLFPLRVNTDRENMYPAFFPYIDRPIAPGTGDQFLISLRFGPPGSTVQTLAPDTIQNFGTVFPQILNWTDHRAVAAIFLATSNTGWPTNPRGFMIDPNVNVFTPAGLADFRNRVLSVADSSVKILKDMNGQGMVTWDIEGQQYPHATTYNGDPRMLAQLAPEMEAVADAYFKKFTDAGLRVGVCIRPQQLVIAPDGRSGTQNEVADPAQLLIDKIGYAKRRWGATIFYIDSNGGPSDPMDPAIIKKILVAYPDVLLMPEHKNLQYYAYSAPHRQLFLGYGGTPADITNVYLNGFSFINTLDGPISQRYNDLVAAVKHGDILLFKGWFDDQPANSLVKSIYQAAGAASAPSIAITNPLNGAGVSGTVTVSAAASDLNGIAGVQFKVDGLNLGAEIINAPYALSLNTSTLSNGGHSLSAVARNTIGNTAASVPVGITVTNSVAAPPAVTLTSPSDGATIAGIITATAVASDPVGVAGVQFKLDGGNLGAELTAGPDNTSLNTTSLPNGVHTLAAVARNIAGLTASSTVIKINVSNIGVPTANSATFVTTDTTSKGSWKGNYGADGFAIANDGTSYPSYAAIALNGQSFWTWSASTTDVRGLQKSAAADRIGGTWYSSGLTIDVNLTDGKTHQAGLYCVDWDNLGRTQIIDILDTATGGVLDSRSLAGFVNGQYLVWNLKGHVTIRVTGTGGPNAVVSGLFFGSGGTVSTPASAAAAFIKPDLITKGNWKGVYGSDGFVIPSDTTSYPAYAAVNSNGQSLYTWAPSTTDSRALQYSSRSDRLAATWYSPVNFSIDVNLTDGKTHQVALYCLDWDYLNRAETIDILDASTGNVLDTRNITGFSGGEYLIWNLTGHVTIRLSRAAGANAVISGLFFGSPANSASFANADVNTKGSWKGVYGTDGYALSGDVVNYPAYATVALNGQLGWTWAASTADLRAPQKSAATDRIASTWYSAQNGFSFDVNLTDGKSHRMALYCLDWDYLNRAETIDILDASTGSLLDSRSVANFGNGQHLLWNVFGHVTIRVTRTAGANAVVSGIFFQ